MLIESPFPTIARVVLWASCVRIGVGLGVGVGLAVGVGVGVTSATVTLQPFRNKSHGGYSNN